MKKSMKKLLIMRNILILFSLILVGCSSNKHSVLEKGSDTMTWETILENSHGGPVKPQIIVAKEASITEEFYAQINKARKPGFAIPEIDYTKEMLIMVCMGEKNTGGYGSSIYSVVDKGSYVEITIKDTTPEKGAMTTMVITQPFYIAKLPTTNKRIVFKKL